MQMDVKSTIVRPAARASAKPCGPKERVSDLERQHRILAEYCHGPFYMGWHLYVRERTDGVRNADGGWGWCRGALSVGRVRDLCLTMGYRDEDMPEVNYHSGSGKYHEFVDWFAYEFPLGVGVASGEWGSWKQVPFHLDADLERDLVDPRPRLYFFYQDGRPVATVAASRGAAYEILAGSKETSK